MAELVGGPVNRKGRILRIVLVVLALPGLALLAHDILRSSPESVAERVHAFEPRALAAAEESGVPAELVLAVIAAESKGEPGARSGKGAVGLMQLLVPTAREEAARLGLPEPDERALTDPALNIRLGSAYLARQLERFGDEGLALAAYHAGPHRVSEWIRAWPGRPPEEVLARAAFSSTRAYVANVMEYRERFRHSDDER